MAMHRLDKLIALHCNVSRRDARRLIKDGAVCVNGALADHAQALIDTDNDTVAVKGHEFELKEHIYIMLNKPAGVISATNDPQKQTVIDILPDSIRRRSLFPAGRLDRDTTGLLIITDDGDFAHRLMSPAHHVWKTYVAGLESPLTPEDIARLEGGIALDDGTECLPARVEAICENSLPAARIRIREGKYHQVKRMFAACGNKVVSLRREQIGALRLDENLASGECLELDARRAALIFEEEQ